jgi:splicing factor 3A subunit 1
MSLVVVGANGVEDPTSEASMMKGQSGKVQGVIIPPPDIRAVVDKTAQFVARHGKEFEQKIIEKASNGDSNSSKFNFMRSHDPYNAYYEFKIKEFEDNGGVAPPKPPPKPVSEEDKTAPATDTSDAPVVSSGIVRKQKMNPIALALTKKSGGKPHPPQFSLVHPTGLSAMDVEIIKLSAQYTAVSGRNFLAGLAQREQRNPQFDFLKPTHLLFSYFTALVDAYSKVSVFPLFVS